MKMDSLKMNFCFNKFLLNGRLSDHCWQKVDMLPVSGEGANLFSLMYLETKNDDFFKVFNA